MVHQGNKEDPGQNPGMVLLDELRERCQRMVPTRRCEVCATRNRPPGKNGRQCDNITSADHSIRKNRGSVPRDGFEKRTTSANAQKHRPYQSRKRLQLLTYWWKNSLAVLVSCWNFIWIRAGTLRRWYSRTCVNYWISVKQELHRCFRSWLER